MAAQSLIRDLLALYLPVLFPSWRFFDQIGPAPIIEVRAEGTAAWRDLCPVPVRLGAVQAFAALFYSPARAERLFLLSLATRLAIEPDDRVRAFLEARIRAALPDRGAKGFEYRISFRAREEGRIGSFIDYESGPVPGRRE